MNSDRIFIGALAVSMAVHLIAGWGLPIISKNSRQPDRNMPLEVTYLTQGSKKTKIAVPQKVSVPKPSKPPLEKKIAESLLSPKPQNVISAPGIKEKIDVKKKDMQVVKLQKTAAIPEKTKQTREELFDKTNVVNLQELSASDEFLDYYEAIRSKIKEVVIYPPEAQNRKIEGVARLYFCIDNEGNLMDVKLISSAKNSYLDWAALKGIKDANPFPGFPKELRVRFSKRAFYTEVTFQLN